MKGGREGVIRECPRFGDSGCVYMGKGQSLKELM